MVVIHDNNNDVLFSACINWFIIELFQTVIMSLSTIIFLITY